MMMRLFLCALFLSLSAGQEQEIQTAESGQDVILKCRAPNSKSLTGVEWRKNNLKPEDILLYRDEQFVSENQNPSFKNRVDLQDRQMKDGDVSVIVKDVTINDTGTYTCRALTPGRKRGKRAAETVKIITLRVVDPPPGPGGGSADLAAGVAVCVVVLVAVAAAVGFVFYKKRTRNQSVDSSQPSFIELQPLESV